MTIEEKAKAYDEAIKIAKETYNTQPMYRNWLESMFPELQENEIKDMREKLIKAFGSIGKKEWGGVNVKDVIHWLEKQGYTKKDIDNAYLKGICDTKHELEKQGEQKPTSNTRYKVSAGGSLIVVDGKPFDYEHATITQKDFAPKQESKKIEDEIEIPFGAKDSELREETYYIPKDFHSEIDDDKVVIKKGEKPTEWSDEDEENLQHCCMAISADSLHTYEDKQEMEVWLKSLKNRIGG